MTSPNKESKKGMWQPYQGDDVSWGKMLKNFPDKGYLNDTSWGKHLSNMGWVCLRWEFSKSENPIAYCQSFFKSYPFGIGVLWIPDGIIGNYRYISSLNRDLNKNLGLRSCYIKFRDSMVFNANDYIELLKVGWVRPATLLSNGMTMSLNLSQSIEDIQAGLTQNWRRSLKKSLKMPFNIVSVSDPVIIAQLYSEMKSSKSLSTREIFSQEAITSMMKCFKENIIVLGAEDKEGNLVAIRGALVSKNKATDIFAATSNRGRALMASHAVFMALLSKCHNQGCKLYDLNGINPSNNMGVYNFKKGTGASPLVSLGEFEWSNNRLLAFVINFKSKYW
ncbi:aminoacyltransferase [Pseudomonadales bacterium]|nr:aminoacyltransferase [Pseudomonadales bacterium]